VVALRQGGDELVRADLTGSPLDLEIGGSGRP